MATTRAKPTRTNRGKTKSAADTAAVLGNAAAAPRIPAKWQSHYQQLMKARERLTREQGRLIETANEERHTVLTDHIADAGTDSYDRDFALGIASSEQQALFEIEEALNRIKTGGYGICEATGKKIAAERLEAIPWTRFSAEAERDLERNNNGVDRAKLGDLKDLPRGSRVESEEEEEEEEK